MEQKLKEFKSRRRKEMLMQKSKDFFLGIINKVSPKKTTKELESEQTLLSDDDTVSEGSNSTLLLNTSEGDRESEPLSYYNITVYVLYAALWVVSYMIAIQLEFGFVYLVVSGLLFIYFNTRTGPKKKGEISAYSVFNPGCKAIDGTLKAEQLEREFNLIQH